MFRITTMQRPKRVALIAADYPIYEKFCPSFTGMQDGLTALGIEHKLFTCRPTFDSVPVIEYEPDLVVYCLLDMVKHKNWRDIIREGLPKSKIVMWYGDLRNDETGQVRAYMDEIDMMFVSNNAQNQFYEKIWRVPKCHFLPLGATVKNPLPNEKYKFDFIFLGARITGNAFMKRAIEIEKFRDEGLKIIDADAARFPDLRAKILQEMPSLYRTAKISLDISHFTDIDGYTSNRFWNISASGGFALTKRFPGCQDFYPEHTRAYFDTLEEAVQLKDYYLLFPNDREKLRQAGHEHAKNHDYEYRFLEMFAKLYGG